MSEKDDVMQWVIFSMKLDRDIYVFLTELATERAIKSLSRTSKTKIINQVLREFMNDYKSKPSSK